MLTPRCGRASLRECPVSGHPAASCPKIVPGLARSCGCTDILGITPAMPNSCGDVGKIAVRRRAAADPRCDMRLSYTFHNFRRECAAGLQDDSKHGSRERSPRGGAFLERAWALKMEPGGRRERMTWCALRCARPALYLCMTSYMFRMAAGQRGPPEGNPVTRFKE